MSAIFENSKLRYRALYSAMLLALLYLWWVLFWGMPYVVALAAFHPSVSSPCSARLIDVEFKERSVSRGGTYLKPVVTYECRNATGEILRGHTITWGPSHNAGLSDEEIKLRLQNGATFDATYSSFLDVVVLFRPLPPNDFRSWIDFISGMLGFVFAPHFFYRLHRNWFPKKQQHESKR